MPSLYELTNEFMACIELENGDVINTETGEVLSYEMLDALQMEREKKIESIACQIKNLNADAEAIKTEMEALMMRRKRAERKAEWLRDYLAANLNGEKFKSARCEIKYTKSAPLEIEDEAAFRSWALTNHPDFLTIQEPKINKNEVKRCLNDGEEIPGAVIVERLNINIK